MPGQHGHLRTAERIVCRTVEQRKFRGERSGRRELQPDGPGQGAGGQPIQPFGPGRKDRRVGRLGAVRQETRHIRLRNGQRPLDPLVSNYTQPQKKNGKDVYSYMLSFYTRGGTAQKQQVSTQSEEAFPGDELIILIGPGSSTPRSFDPAAGSDQVLFTKTDNTANGGGALFDKTNTPAGKALVYVNASGVPIGATTTAPTSTPPNGSRSAGLTFDVGQDGKGCLPEVGPQAPAPGDTHSRSLTSPGSIGGFFYVVSPGSQRLNLYSATDTGCHPKPIAGPFEINVTSGHHLAVLLYGPPDNLKSLTLPL